MAWLEPHKLPARRPRQAPRPVIRVTVRATRLPARGGRYPRYVRDRSQVHQVATVLRLLCFPVLLVIRFYAWMFGALWAALKPSDER